MERKAQVLSMKKKIFFFEKNVLKREIFIYICSPFEKADFLLI